MIGQNVDIFPIRSFVSFTSLRLNEREPAGP